MPDARALLSTQKIDVMLLDIEVIRGTGIELLQWAREHGYDAPCVFLTNYESFAYAKEAVRLGSVDYVLKTEPISVIEAAVRRAAGIAQPDVLFAAGESERDGAYAVQHEVNKRTETWEQMLLENRRSALLSDMRAYLAQTADGGNAGVFMVIQHDFTQTVYRLLKRLEIATSAMFRSEEDTLLYRNAANSQFDLLRWLNRFSQTACELLAETTQAQSVAAQAVGYDNYAYFSTVFKKLCGITPSEYRKEHFGR